MTKKEKTALLRFARKVAKSNGRNFDMSEMTILESGTDSDGTVNYVMFEYADGSQWQASPTTLSEYRPMVLDDAQCEKLANVILPPMDVALAFFNESGFVGSFWEWFDTLSLDEIIAMRQHTFQSTGMYETEKMKADVVPPETSLVPQDHNLNSMNAATAYIREQIDIVAQSFCKIGFKLWEVKENHWYKSLGFKGVGEYGEKVLGFKKSSVSNYISICERFSVLVDGKPTAELREDFSAFSYTQLSEMLTLPNDKISDVTPDMTCKEVRALKKDAEHEQEDEAEQEVFEDGQPYNLFARTLTQGNFETVVNLLKDVIGKEIQIIVG